ncbi:4-hydroxy-tetrahydrodipicolinate reductase [Peptococcus simiae]|uniref:4-hydroxy-tetrahydrodipicolinate reductase n=1 Tax=Peptococcus simiae TaxID=1643805 RepID=A0ABW9GZW8_9FIRM
MKIILSGATGAMGRMVADQVQAYEDMEIVFGWAGKPEQGGPFPISAQLEEAPAADVIIDFSNHATLTDLLAYARPKGLPLVIATTGHTEAEMTLMEEAAKDLAIFHSGNFSLGVHVLKLLARQAAKALPDFDIEIIEAHHHRKVDAPSGTAKMLVSAIQEERPDSHVVGGREGHVGARPLDEIGVHAVRGGSIVGEHTVLLAGLDEMIEIKHTALSRAIFAKGALAAAQFIGQAQPGMYNMDDMIG